MDREPAAFLRGLPLPWQREAEVSFRSSGGWGVQLRLPRLDDLTELLARKHAPAELAARSRSVTERFLLYPSHWIKFDSSGAIHQYFLVRSDAHYPLTTLRLFARRFGAPACDDFEAVLKPLLIDPLSRWGLALKGDQPALFVWGSRAAAQPLLARAAPELSRFCDRFPRHERFFFSFDPTLSTLAVDVEEPGFGELEPWPQLQALCTLPPRYLKQKAGHLWTAYYAWPCLWRELPARDLPQHAASYYDWATAGYLDTVGEHLQAGRVEGDADGSLSNRRWFESAGIAAGQKVLDAGCGVGGPALQLVQHYPQVEVEAVTISAVGAQEARQRVAAAGLSSRLRVHQADYHRLPFAPQQFDRILFLETSGYTHDALALFTHMRELIAADGRLYIKDVFLPEQPLDDAAHRALCDYDFTYQCRTRSLSQTQAALRQAGWEVLRCQPLDLHMEHYVQPIFSPVGGSQWTRYHARDFPVGLIWGEVLARPC